MGFPHSSVGKESACNAGDPGLIPGSGRSPREGNGNPLQYSCLKNPMDRRTWQARVHGVTRVGYDLATKPLPHKWNITFKNYESLCCTPETYNIVNQLYLNLRRNFKMLMK